MTSIKDRLIIKLANHVTVAKGKKAMAHLEEITKHPAQTQQEFLMRLMHDNRDTEYGREHCFANIHNIEDFRKNVPLTLASQRDKETKRQRDIWYFGFRETSS